MADKTNSLSDIHARFGRAGVVMPTFLPTPFRQAHQQGEAASTAELDALFKDDASLLHSQTVAAYLQPFCTKPEDMKSALQDLKEIWLQEGFLPIDDLTQQLITRRHPDLPEAAVNILHKQIAANYRDVEPLTRYDRKEHAPLTVGLGHVYGVLTGRAVTLVLADDSNLGGLTELIDKLFAARDGRPPGQTQEGSEAFELADRILRAMAGVARDALQEGIALTRRMASHTDYRNGGDEKLHLVTGIPDTEMQKIVDNHMTPAVEELNAALGLQEHEAIKNRDLRVYAGTSTGYVVIKLNAHTRPGIDLTAADQTLSERKFEAGILRRGRAPLGSFNNLSSYSKLRDDLVAEHDQPIDPNLLELDMADRLVRNAAARRQHYDAITKANGTAYEREAQALDYDLPTYDAASDTYGSTNQRHLAPYNMSAETAGRLLSRIEEILSREPYAKYQQPLPKAAEVERAADRPNILFATPIELEAMRFDYNVQKSHLNLSAAQTKICHRMLASFSPIDPPTGALMKDVMPGLFGRFARDAQRLRDYLRVDADVCTELGTKPEQVTAIAIAAALHNLAGVNKLLGSKNADIMLRHFTDEVVKGSFKAQYVGSENLEIGHEGGGNLMILVRPIVKSGKSLQALDAKLLNKITDGMTKRMDKWRGQKVAAFLRKHGGTVPEGLDDKMTFANIIDPKRSTPGINLTTAIMSLTTSAENGVTPTGGQLRKKLADMRDAKINASRTGNVTNRKTSANIPS